VKDKELALANQRLAEVNLQLNKEAQTKGKFLLEKDKELAAANQRLVKVTLQLNELKASEEN
jgi:hypothetical protein